MWFGSQNSAAREPPAAACQALVRRRMSPMELRHPPRSAPRPAENPGLGPAAPSLEEGLPMKTGEPLSPTQAEPMAAAASRIETREQPRPVMGSSKQHQPPHLKQTPAGPLAPYRPGLSALRLPRTCFVAHRSGFHWRISVRRQVERPARLQQCPARLAQLALLPPAAALRLRQSPGAGSDWRWQSVCRQKQPVRSRTPVEPEPEAPLFAAVRLPEQPDLELVAVPARTGAIVLLVFARAEPRWTRAPGLADYHLEPTAHWPAGPEPDVPPLVWR
ncbi:hypothetical protein CHH27_01205 [Labrenzia sp. VG12]|nr:hypothetical protein CHH27_01205 [Labrenzia sp. VG12]